MDFPQQLEACVKQANQALSRFIAPLPFQNTPVVETMQYGALLGGKRLRPFLVYATGHMFGVSTNTLDAPAAAVECIHAYSLIHDDLPAMDDDDLRRGLPTCHVKFGEANAILAGDALQTLAFSILSDADMPEVSDRDRISMISELASASGIAGMCGGQALDLDAEGKHVPLDALERIHRHKTGALIRAAVRLGALSAGDKGVVLCQYSTSTQRASALPSRFRMTSWMWWEILQRWENARVPTSNLVKVPTALLGLEQARKKARDLIDDARQSLKQLAEQSLDTSALEALADYIIQRNK